MTCLFLACKVEEYQRKLDYVIIKCHQLWNRQDRPSLKSNSDEYERLRQSVLKCERVMLHTIAFDLCIKHPFDDIIKTVRRLHDMRLVKKDQQRALAKQTVMFLNDSMRTNLCLQFDLRKVAHACIYLATEYLNLGISDTNQEKWLSQKTLTADELQSISEQIMQLYETMHGDSKTQEMVARFCRPHHSSSNGLSNSSRPHSHSHSNHATLNSGGSAAASSANSSAVSPPQGHSAFANAAAPPPPPPPNSTAMGQASSTSAAAMKRPNSAGGFL